MLWRLGVNELAQICLAYRNLVGRAEPAFLATSIRFDGSAQRQAGARMLFSEGRVVAGALGGGRLEADIVGRGPWLCADQAHLGRYEDDDEQSIGTSSDGSAEILIERVGPLTPGPFPLIEGCLREERRGAVATIINADTKRRLVGARVELGPDASPPSARLDDELKQRLLDAAGAALRSGTSAVERVGAVDVFVEAIEPPPHLFLFGGGPDALPLATLANTIGWSVTVWEPNGRSSVRDRFAGIASVFEGTAAQTVERVNRAGRPLSVVMSRHYETDAAALAELVGSRALYVGVLGPPRRLSRLLDELDVPGVAAFPRVHGPAGLELGARSPAEIALSIIAEAQAALTGTSARSLSSRRTSLHALHANVGGAA